MAITLYISVQGQCGGHQEDQRETAAEASGTVTPEHLNTCTPAHQESEEEVVTLRSSLSQYQAAGPDFQPIVLEYAR